MPFSPFAYHFLHYPHFGETKGDSLNVKRNDYLGKKLAHC
ncbi:hypothetical protein SLEP1_g23192 [Rubroshorea leprosula]|uniref:Uncharacterized protein n=1 Tax=Rubroshorea leprosula TaxID=152421 RepID=A0AAV5JHR7_9ROSI|nr:hypothetical protein SLEP1_g23192 [Rubroshorea leprosula]